jgi:hypothetical protein
MMMYLRKFKFTIVFIIMLFFIAFLDQHGIGLSRYPQAGINGSPISYRVVGIISVIIFIIVGINIVNRHFFIIEGEKIKGTMKSDGDSYWFFVDAYFSYYYDDHKYEEHKIIKTSTYNDNQQKNTEVNLIIHPQDPRKFVVLDKYEVKKYLL